MTVNVSFTVPSHVHAVIVQFENHTAEHGWLPADAQVVLAGQAFSAAIHDTRRISCIVERTAEQMHEGEPTPSAPPIPPGNITLNEHAHGDDHHESARNHG